MLLIFALNDGFAEYLLKTKTDSKTLGEFYSHIIKTSVNHRFKIAAENCTDCS
jgi:hypothetical protein